LPSHFDFSSFLRFKRAVKRTNFDDKCQMSNVKNIYVCREFESEAPAAEEMLD